MDTHDTGIGVRLTEIKGSPSQAKPDLTQTKAEKGSKTEQKTVKNRANPTLKGRQRQTKGEKQPKMGQKWVNLCQIGQKTAIFSQNKGVSVKSIYRFVSNQVKSL